MELVHPQSLAQTLDSINHAIFEEVTIARAKRLDAAKFIASRQGLKRCYAGMFAPTDYDFNTGIRLFTGEKVTTGAGTGHILGEEACRAMRLLDAENKATREALAAADAGMQARLSEHTGPVGMYCCGTCSVSMWRNLLSGGLDDREKRLASGLRELKKQRDGKGRWGRFPFYYTVLALSEMDLPAARTELKYAAESLKRTAKRDPKADVYAQRRKQLAERVLALV